MQNITNLFNLLLAIIVDSGHQNVHADSEVVCFMLSTTIEQESNSYRVQTFCASNEAQLTLQYVYEQTVSTLIQAKDHVKDVLCSRIIFESVGWGCWFCNLEDVVIGRCP